MATTKAPPYGCVDIDEQTPAMLDLELPTVRDLTDFRKKVESRPRAGIPSVLPEPLPPPPGEFRYSAAEYKEIWSSERDAYVAKLPKVLTPPPSATPSNDRCFPQSPVWTLQEDDCYALGVIYVADYNIAEQYPVDKYKMLKVDTPPGIAPLEQDGRYYADPNGVPGMTQMIAGVPYVFFLDGDSERPYTFGCSQTLESLKAYKDYDEIVDTCVQLAKLTWGCKEYKGCPEIIPIFNAKGLGRNQRSLAQKKLPAHRKDGSYSFTGTGMQGVGGGIWIVAAQGDSKGTQGTLSIVVIILKKTYCYVISKCISKFDLAVIEYIEIQNNVITFGGLGLSGTSCQMNVSSLSNESLQEMLGHQGYWHPDPLDDPLSYTVLVMLLRVGPDGDPGPFCLGRGGIYCRETNSWIVFLVFKGNDMHSGFSPSERRDKHEEWVEREEARAAWNLAGEENRIAYVIYMSEIMTTRQSGLNMMPMQQFGNFSNSAHLKSNRNFAEHGMGILGGQSAWANRCGVEIVMQFWNQLHALNLDPGFTVTNLMEQISYKDDTTGESVTLQPPRLDPILDQPHIELYARYYAWYHQQCHSMLIRVLRSPFKKDLAQHLLQQQRQGQSAFSKEHLYQGSAEDEDTYSDDVLELENPIDLDSLPVEKILGQKTDEDGVVVYSFQLSAVGNAAPEVLRISKASLAGSTQLAEMAARCIPQKLPLALLPVREASPHKGNADADSPESHREVPTAVEQIGWRIIGGEDGSGDLGSDGEGLSVEGEMEMEEGMPRVTRGREDEDGTTDDEEQAGSDLEMEVHGRKRKAKVNNHPRKRVRPWEEDTEFDVKEIRGKRWNNVRGRVEYEIVWEGGDVTYEPIEHLNGCLTLVKRFDADHISEDPNLQALEVIAEAELDASTAKIATQGALEPCRLFQALDLLQNLFDPERLIADYTTIADALKMAPSKPKEWKDALGDHHKFADWVLQNQTNFVLSTWTSAVSKDTFQYHHLQLQWMTLNASRVPQLVTTGLLATINSRLTTWEIGRILVQAYIWHTQHSVKLVSLVFGVFRNHTSTFEEIEAQYPFYAPLAAHILHYSFGRHVEDLETRSSSKKKGKNQSTKTLFTQKRQPPQSFGPTPDTPNIIPSNLYGLMGESKAPGVVKCSAFLASKASFRTLEDVYTKSETIFIAVLRDVLLTPKLERLDRVFEQEDKVTRPRSSGLSSVWYRCVARGALLHVVASVVGSDSIFASHDFLSFTVSPIWVYKQKELFNGTSLRSDQAFVQFITKDPAKGLEPVKLWMADYIDGQNTATQIKDAVNKLGNLLHEFVVKQQNKGGGASGKGGVRNQTKLVLRELAPGVIKVSPEPIGVAVLAVIIQEALNKERALPVQHEGLRRVLLGENPFTRLNTLHNPDQTNPFRHTNIATGLFKRHLGGHIEESEWLSNALAWMGTGQGVKTQRFLDAVLPNGGFYRTTCDAQVLMFENVLEENARKALEHGPGRIAEDTLTGWFYTCDSQIWGQSSNHLKLFPTVDGREMTLREKLDQYWAPEVVEGWKRWIGQPKENKTWRNALDLLYGLRIRGFQSGLTVFQLANNMAILGIASMPTEYNIPDWINSNRDLGAYGGLQFLGFSMDTCGAIRCAFDCVLSHLEEYMTEDDKKLAGFGPIFVEHILCKIVRWDNRYGVDEQGRSYLRMQADIAVQKQQDSPWQAGANLASHLCLPFPVVIQDALVERVVKRYNNIICNVAE